MTTKRYFHPVFASRPAISDAERSALYQRIAAVMDDSVAKHMRADVTVGAFLSGGIDSTAIAALAKRYNPDLMTFTTGFEREGFSEVDVAAESAAAIGVRHVIRTVSETELTETLPLIIWYLDDPVADPGAGAAVLRGQGGPQARQGGALRRGRRRAVRRLQHLSRADEPAQHHRPAGRHAQGPGGGGTRTAARVPRAGHAPPRLAGPGGPVLRQRPDLPRGAARRAAEDLRPGPLVPGHHRSDLRADARNRSHRAHAARRPVHLDARRHSRQGRQDDDGELARAAGAVPGHRGVRGGQDDPGGSEGHQADDQAGAAPGDGADRPAARAAPAQTRLPGADPAFPGRGLLRVGQVDHPDGEHPGISGSGRRAGPAGRAQGRRGRPFPAHLDDPGLPALARNLRHRRHHPDDPRARLPVFL